MEVLESLLDPVVYKSLLVLLAAATGIWKAVPLGLLLKLHPALIFLMTSLGGMISVLILFFSGNKIKSLLFKHRERQEKSRKAKRIRKILEKYGPAGLGLIGTLVAGQITTVLIGLALVRSQKEFLWYALAGTVLASLIITLLGVFGVDLFERILKSLNFI